MRHRLRDGRADWPLPEVSLDDGFRPCTDCGLDSLVAPAAYIVEDATGLQKYACSTHAVTYPRSRALSSYLAELWEQAEAADAAKRLGAEKTS